MNKLPTISVCASVRDEKEAIEGYIESLVGFADEIVLSDTGSADNTIEIIKSMQEKYPNLIKLVCFDYEGGFHYGEAKNNALKYATKDYSMILDADERLGKDFKSQIKQFLNDEKPTVVSIRRADDLLTHFIESVERIVKTGENIRFGVDSENKVHEQFIHKHSVKTFEPPIWHIQRTTHWLNNPHKKFFYLELEIDRTPKTKSFFGHLLRGLWMFQFKFKKVYFNQKMKKDGKAGFKYAFLRGLYAFLIQFFVGLKPNNDYKYWESKKYKEKMSKLI